MIIVILQARMSSTRLPGKVLKNILNKSLLQHHVERIRRAQLIDQIVVATSYESSDDPIAEHCLKLGFECFRGSLNNVLDRYYKAACHLKANHVVRITADCPLIDPAVIDATVAYHVK